jgi:hypothetical protein
MMMIMMTTIKKEIRVMIFATIRMTKTKTTTGIPFDGFDDKADRRLVLLIAAR